MRYIRLQDVLILHAALIRTSGGTHGLNSIESIESAIAQPRMTFDRTDLYPTITEKAAALGFSLIQNHPFTDGNKRTGHAAMRLFLRLNKYRIAATVDEQEQIILQVARGELPLAGLASWLQEHSAPEE